MPTECIADLFGFAPVEGRRVEAAFDGGTITSDAGGLLLGLTDRAIGLIERFARCFKDHRDPELIEHTVRTLVGQRVLGLAWLSGPQRPRPSAAWSTVGGAAGQARGEAVGLCADCGQEHAEPSRTELPGADEVSQDQPRQRGDRDLAG